MSLSPASSEVESSIVSGDWLATHAGDHGLVILDIRTELEYAAGHIPGSVISPFARWTATRNGLLLELPDRSNLFRVIGEAGIDSVSTVVVVGKTDNPYPLADAACVADRLIYAGVKSVAILDGGHDKWVREARVVSRESARPVVLQYHSETDERMFVSKDRVKNGMASSKLIDARDPAVYFGLVKEPTAQRPGHIPTARCLPAPWIWRADGTYRETMELEKMAQGIVGADLSEEIVVYCGVGGYAAAWWFVFSQVLGYRGVKIYNGSAQEWTMDPDAPLVCFRWE